jgi:hypothetical protein
VLVIVVKLWATMKLALVFSALVGSQAMELDKAGWEAATAGKSVFVKFLAPW